MQEALAAAADLPALGESRDRLLTATGRPESSVSQITLEVESDPALAIAVMRAAGRNGSRSRGGVSSVPEAVAALAPVGVEAAVEPLGTYDFFDSGGQASNEARHFRRHALATLHAADHVAQETPVGTHDSLAAAALLHDVGKMVLSRLYDDYGERVGERSLPAGARVAHERREFGLDHALIGGVLVRRWGVAEPVATAIEHHHDSIGNGTVDLAAALRLADMVAHHHHGNAVAAVEIEQVATGCRLEPQGLRRLLHEFPYERAQRSAPKEPSPLSPRELSALQGLADGKVYKQIAAELGLSVSTIRSHLHNVYRKIDVADRAQAVLKARERGWI